MSALSIQPPYPAFAGADGLPLENGYIWVGTVNLNPQTNPISVYWDAALTIAAVQPIRTLNGYPMYQGTPACLYAGSDYSILVQDSKGSAVYSAPAVTERYSDVVISGVNAENVIYDPPFIGGVQTNVEARLAQTVSVKDFGAVGDGVADDTAAIQDALDYAQTVVSSQTISVYFPRGLYMISSGLTVTTAGTEIRIYGEHLRSSQIKATASMTNMLTLGTSVGFYGRMMVDGLGFNCNSLATNGIDAEALRYSTIQNNEFNNIPANGYAIKMGRWVTRIDNNLIDGNGVGNGILVPNQTTNNCVITRNSMTSCAVGVRSNSNVHDLHIAWNTFDVCSKAAIFISVGGRNIQIQNNYFEVCGTTTVGGGVDIPAVLGGVENYSAAIVATFDAGDAANSQLENLVITGNQFAQCVNTGLAVISGVYGLTWEDNHALKQYSYAYAVRFVQRAIAEGIGTTRKIVVQQDDYNSQFTELVELNPANLATTSRSNLQVVWNRGQLGNFAGPQYQILPQNVASAPWSTTSGTVTSTGTFYEGVQPIYEFSASPAGVCQLVIPIDANNQTMRGRYFRLSYLTRSTGTDDGVRCVIAIDTGSGYSDIANLLEQSTNWVVGSRGYTFYVPTNAVGLRFTLSRGASQTCQLTNLVLDAASAPVRQ